eukprot:403336223
MSLTSFDNIQNYNLHESSFSQQPQNYKVVSNPMIKLQSDPSNNPANLSNTVLNVKEDSAKKILRQEKTSFEASYQKMTENFITQIQSGEVDSIQMLLLSDRDLTKFKDRETNKQKRLSVGKSPSVFQSLYEEKSNIKERYSKLIEERHKFEDSQFKNTCTFQPQLVALKGKGSNNSSRSRNRSPEKFYTEMLNFKQRVDQKLKVMRKEKAIEELNMSRKSLRNQSINRLTIDRNQETDSHNSTQVFEKLYSLGLTRNLNKSTSNLNQTYSNIQNTTGNENSLNTTKRKLDSSIIEKLYQDANRLTSKLHQSRERRNHQLQNQSSTALQSISLQKHKKNQTILKDKLLKELRKAYQFFGLIESDLLNYHQLALVLQKLDYIQKRPKDRQEQEAESQLTLQIWNTLLTKEYFTEEYFKEGISFKNLLKFILGLNKIFEVQISDSQNNVPNQERQQSLEHLQQNEEFNIRSLDECEKLRGYFRKLIYNQKSQVNHDKNEFIQESIKQELTGLFKPVLSQKSLNIANKQLQIMQKELGKNQIKADNYADILLKKGELYKERKTKMKDIVNQSEIDGCTYKPKIKEWKGLSNLSLNQTNLNETTTNSNRTDALHIINRRKSQGERGTSSVHESLYKIKKQRKDDRKAQEIEFEKSRNQCTFKPNLTLSQTHRTKLN